MVFRCDSCKKVFLFQKFKILEEKKCCFKCFNISKEEKVLQNEQKRKEFLLRKKQKRIENKKLADIKLKKEIEKGKRSKKKEILKVTKPKIVKLIKETVPQKKVIKNKPEIISLEKQAKQESRLYGSVLYIFVDVKHVRAIEWKGGKKRVALNKEREVRRTHAGGFSQEKFQSFIDSKKKKTAEWAIDLLGRNGILRGPYEKLIIDCNDEIKEKIKHFLEEKGLDV
jgi:hypothetical protein